MEDTLTATIPDPELAKLEAMAVEHDTQAREELSANEPEPAQPAAEKEKPEGEINPDNSETDPEKVKVERPRDELGRFTKTEAGEDIPETERKPAEQEKPESDYDKAKKKQEREKGLLANFQKDKEAFYAESERIRAQLQREAAELQRAREQRTSPGTSQSQQMRYSSAELWEAANDFDVRAEKAFEAGDPEAFKESLRMAREARQQAGQVQQLEQQATQQAQAHRFQTVYAQGMEQAIQAEPELAKGDSPLSKDVQTLLEQEAVFSHIPDGFAKAVQVAKWKRDAGLVSELRDKLTKAEAEVQRLTKERTPLGAGPTTPIQAQDFDKLSTDKQMERLERMAAQYDEAAAA